MDIGDAPFNGHRCDNPALNHQEIEDVAGFVKTLTGDYGEVGRVAASNSR
jgi:hypothetical protein